MVSTRSDANSFRTYDGEDKDDEDGDGEDEDDGNGDDGDDREDEGRDSYCKKEENRLKSDDKHGAVRDHECIVYKNTNKSVDVNVSPGVQSDNTHSHDSLCKLSVQDLQQAEEELIKHAQGKAFSEEIAILKESLPNKAKGRGHRLKKTSTIYRLNPQFKDGIIQVGGSLTNAVLPERQKFPIIIPKKSAIARLILHDIHEVYALAMEVEIRC